MPFQKGNKGGGRPKGFKGLAKMIQDKTKDGRELVDFALRVFRDEEQWHGARWDALQWLSNRGFGLPMQMVDLDAAISVQEAAPRLDVTRLSPQQRGMLREVLLRALARPIQVGETTTGNPLRVIEGGE